MIDNPFDDFVSVDETPLFEATTGKKRRGVLLWGDGVHATGAAVGGRRPVRARGVAGFVDEAALGGAPLLEVYFIDVGQGDGVLIRTPDFRHVMIDGGHPRISQPSGKNAADFVDWKFFKDYGLKRIALDAMIISHNDFDHYGGLSDLLDVEQEAELDCDGVDVEAFYHAGVSWWVGENGKRTLGAFEEEGDESFFTQILGDRASVLRALDPQSGAPQLQGEWRTFLDRVRGARKAQGGPTPIKRLSTDFEHLPGFDDNAACAVRVLGPVAFEVDGKPAVRRLAAADSQNTNGNSVLLRLDYKNARILLTGDLNKASQNALMADYEGMRLEFKCDVAKACHHGSEDVSYAFLQAMEPAATIISSGDGEGHDHPRPRIVAASGAAGYLTVEDDEILTPLVYCTELARSYKLGRPEAARAPAGGGEPAATLDAARLGRTEIDLEVRTPGGLRPQRTTKKLGASYVVAGLTYGLVNLRTDGERIMLATMDENGDGWSTKSFQSRF